MFIVKGEKQLNSEEISQNVNTILNNHVTKWMKNYFNSFSPDKDFNLFFIEKHYYDFFS